MSAMLGSRGGARREQQRLRLAQALLAAYLVSGYAAAPERSRSNGTFYIVAECLV
jgi:hypothetical protein